MKAVPYRIQTRTFNSPGSPLYARLMFMKLIPESFSSETLNPSANMIYRLIERMDIELLYSQFMPIGTLYATYWFFYTILRKHK